MTTQDQIQNWFRAAVPEPTDKSRAVQIGCHYEEAGEMANALGDFQTAGRLSACGDVWKALMETEGIPINRKELLDSLADQIVTAIGVAHMFGFDIAGALAEVNRSNWSKFNEDGRPDFDENGKIKKGPNYSPPNLAPFLGA